MPQCKALIALPWVFVAMACPPCCRYDPNYADDMSEDGVSGDGSEGGDTDDDVSEEDYSDDDDMSWKVRR